MAKKPAPDRLKQPPLETGELRKAIKAYHTRTYKDPVSGDERPVGTYRWGVYAFYDYDGEPIYVGQTYERLSSRVGRHLTNQRTDAVAMSVLDPFEVAEIEEWPLPQFDHIPNSKHKEFRTAKAVLDALEHAVHQGALAGSRFGAILNEKDPPEPKSPIPLPSSVRGSIVTDEVRRLRDHPDVRIARRALTISRLAQVISERKVQGGLRRVLKVQATRLQSLAERRFEALGGAAIVKKGPNEDGDDDSAES